jgi:hypothetical protein
VAAISVGGLYLPVWSAGWVGKDAQMAVAVILAESGGDPDVTSANPDGGTNVGLFQLDTPHGEGSGYSVAQLKNPQTNAVVAHAAWLRDGKTFTKHWATANNGAAAAKLAQASSGKLSATDFYDTVSPQATANLVAGIPSGPGVDPNKAAGAAGVLGQLATLISFITTPASWGRVALVLVGGALAIAGLNAIAKPVTAPVVSTAKKAAKLAAVA